MVYNLTKKVIPISLIDGKIQMHSRFSLKFQVNISEKKCSWQIKLPKIANAITVFALQTLHHEVLQPDIKTQVSHT